MDSKSLAALEDTRLKVAMARIMEKIDATGPYLSNALEADLKENLIINDKREKDDIIKRATDSQKIIVKLNPGEYNKHKVIKERLSKVILATSEAKRQNIIDDDKANREQMRIAKLLIMKYGLGRVIRAWNEMYWFLIARPNQTAKFNVPNQPPVVIPLYYRGMRDYFFTSFPGKCPKVLFGEEAEEYHKLIVQKTLEDVKVEDIKLREEKEEKDAR